MTTTAQKLAADLEAGWACDTSPDEMTAAAAELRRLDDLCAEQKADADKIKAAITRAGLTLVKTASGYEVRSFGRIEAQAEAPAVKQCLTPEAAPAAPAEPVAWQAPAARLVRWLHCMSYNDRYFGEPAGYLKQCVNELRHLLPPNHPKVAAPAAPAPAKSLVEAARAVVREALDSVDVHPCDVHDDAVRARGLYEPMAALYRALAAAPAAPAPALTIGEACKWRVVPVEPTTGMLVAGNHCQPGDYSAALVWTAMLEAADRSTEIAYLRPRIEGAAPAAPAPTVKESLTPAPAGFVLSPVDIYHFAGWLTTRPGLMKVGSVYEAEPMAEAVGEYLRTYPERFQAAPAAPAQVPLTDEQVERLIVRIFHGKQLKFCPTVEDALLLARAIEEAHGIGAASKGGA